MSTRPTRPLGLSLILIVAMLGCDSNPDGPSAPLRPASSRPSPTLPEKTGESSPARVLD